MTGWPPRVFALVFVRPRLVAAAVLGAAVGLLAPGGLSVSTRCLLGWDVGVTSWLVLVLTMMARSDNDVMQSRADEDAGALVILAMTLLAATVSFVAIGIELNRVHDVTGPAKTLAVALAAATILLSWLFVNTMFAVHYAHDFYGGPDDGSVEDRRGLKIPGTETPDYWDFMYFSFNLGAAAQTSDIAIESRRMRRLVLVHSVMSFLFNTTVLAMAINVGAGLIG